MQLVLGLLLLASAPATLPVTDPCSVTRPEPTTPPEIDPSYPVQRPEYPYSLPVGTEADRRRLPRQGTVDLNLYICPDGLVRKIELCESSGHSQLDLAAYDAAERMRFLPAERDGTRICAWTRRKFKFEMVDE